MLDRYCIFCKVACGMVNAPAFKYNTPFIWRSVIFFKPVMVWVEVLST